MNKTRKTILLLIVIQAIVLIVKGQIPNPGFENWTNFMFHSDPTGWTSPNVASSPWHTITVCTKDTDHTEGSFSVSLNTKYDSVLNTIIIPHINSKELPALQGLKYPSFPITQRPLALAGDWKFDQGIPYNVNIVIMISKWNFSFNKRDTLGIGILNPDISSQLNWTTFTCAIDYQSSDNPDSAAIRILSGFTGMTPGEYLKIDNLHFTFPDALKEYFIINDLAVFPNPSNGSFEVQWDPHIAKPITLTLNNYQGVKVFRNQCINSNGYKFSDLKPGIYLLHGQSRNATFIKKVVVL